jgi:hypothetical protein
MESLNYNQLSNDKCLYANKQEGTLTCVGKRTQCCEDFPELGLLCSICNGFMCFRGPPDMPIAHSMVEKINGVKRRIWEKTLDSNNWCIGAYIETNNTVTCESCYFAASERLAHEDDTDVSGHAMDEKLGWFWFHEYLPEV